MFYFIINQSNLVCDVVLYPLTAIYLNANFIKFRHIAKQIILIIIKNYFWIYNFLIFDRESHF